jgi:hypothetical protein
MPEIGVEALQPNPRLEPFSPFIGTWRTEGSHPLMPGQRLQGRTSFAWHAGGAFLIMHSEMEQQEIPPAVAIFGSDDDGAITMVYFDRRGVSRHYRVTFGEGRMQWTRDDPKISQRMEFTVAGDGKEIRQIGHISQNKGPWHEDLSLTYRLAEGRQD